MLKLYFYTVGHTFVFILTHSWSYSCI